MTDTNICYNLVGFRYSSPLTKRSPSCGEGSTKTFGVKEGTKELDYTAIESRVA